MNENVKAAKCSRICTGFDLPADLQEALGPQLQQACLAVQGPKNSMACLCRCPVEFQTIQLWVPEHDGWRRERDFLNVAEVNPGAWWVAQADPGRRKFLEDGRDEWKPTEVPKQVLRALQTLVTGPIDPPTREEVDVLLIGKLEQLAEELERQQVSGVRYLPGRFRDQVNVDVWDLLRNSQPRVVVVDLDEPEAPKPGDRGNPRRQLGRVVHRAWLKRLAQLP